jgi:hypothetical protein
VGLTAIATWQLAQLKVSGDDMTNLVLGRRAAVSFAARRETAP